MSDVASATAPPAARGLPFQIRGSLQTLLSLRLLRPDDPDFFTLLVDKIAHSPDFFRHAPIVLDVGPLAEPPPLDLVALVARLRQQKLIVVGVQNGGEAWNAAAVEAGLAVLPPGATAAQRPVQQPVAAGPAGSPPRPARGSGQVVVEPVRSGQQIYAAEGDLTVLAPVGNGAEVGAAGHVHIYGALRGRAFAGVDGDHRAMIFCDQLHAELISIAGVYMVAEELDPALLGRRVRVSCAHERLFLTPVA